MRPEELEAFRAQLLRMRASEAGEFGHCFACGEPIDPRRLAVDPTATRCIRCQAG